MKEVTEWNGNPRMMWVWDNNERNVVKKFVVYIASDEECKNFEISFPVVTIACAYRHCAEIEEPRRMTNYELAKWLYEGASCGEFREWKKDEGDYECVNTRYCYFTTDENIPCDESILIRINGGEWHEPLVEENEE